MHVDMDSFYASVELVARPELRGRPVIVGGGARSVVLTASYEARAFGVHSGMPMTSARRICPQAVIIPPNHPAYDAVSRSVMAILAAVTPCLEQVSIDEAYLDVTGSLRRLGPALGIAESIRAQVRSAHAVTCSVGIGANKTVAKIASGRAKPDGVLAVPPGQTVDFLRSLPIGAIPGVGRKTAQSLARWGIATVADVAATPVSTLARAVGQAGAHHLAAIADGRDPRPVSPEHEEKSIGTETTFAVDLAPGAQTRRVLHGLVDKAAVRLRAGGWAAQTVAVKVRTSDFTTHSRSRRLGDPTDLTARLFEVALELMEAVPLHGLPIRLIGVRLENLAPASAIAWQESFDEVGSTARGAQAAADLVRARFGTAAMRPGSLVDGPGASRDGAVRHRLDGGQQPTHEASGGGHASFRI